MFTKINIEDSILLKNEDTENKKFIKSNLYTVSARGDINYNGVNNLLATAATALSILCNDSNAVKNLIKIFNKDRILVDIGNIDNYKDYIANVECSANKIITDAVNWFKSEYSDLLQKVRNCNIDNESRDKISNEFNNALTNIINWISLADSTTLCSMGLSVFSIKEIEKIPDAVSFTIKKLMEIYTETCKELTGLILGNSTIVHQPTVITPPITTQVPQETSPAEPEINIEIEPSISIDVMGTTPDVEIPKGYSASNGEVLAMPFINYQMAYCVPQYNDEDINKHFIINGNVNIPDEKIQKEFGVFLKNVAKWLDKKDKLLGLTEPSKFTFTTFYTNTCWTAERVRKNGSPYKESDKNYQSLTMRNNMPLQWFGPSK